MGAVAMQAKGIRREGDIGAIGRAHPALLHETQDLRDTGDFVVEQRIRVRPGRKRSISLVGPVGKCLGGNSSAARPPVLPA